MSNHRHSQPGHRLQAVTCSLNNEDKPVKNLPFYDINQNISDKGISISAAKRQCAVLMGAPRKRHRVFSLPSFSLPNVFNPTSNESSAKKSNHTMYVGSGESVRVLGVFVCWRALVRVTSQTAAPAAPASLKPFRGLMVLFPK